MRRASQSVESIQSDFDRIASLSDKSWDHNRFYHDYLLKQLPSQCQNALEIGCGTGEFSRLLAERFKKVLAVDLSSEMIRLARARSESFSNIDYINCDVMSYQLPDEYFDCIATLTTLHHLSLEKILAKVKRALKPGGTFICLDLYQGSGLSDFLYDAAAVPISIFFNLIQNGKPRPPKNIREAYAEHGKTDSYLTLPHIKSVCADIFPAAQVKRHLLWRYSIIWKKDFPPIHDRIKQPDRLIFNRRNQTLLRHSCSRKSF